MMAAALMLINLHSTDKKLFLFDTFEEMPSPSAIDIDLHGISGEAHMLKAKQDTGDNWNYA